MSQKFIIYPLLGLLLTGCGTINRTIDNLERNQQAIDMSTAAIEENTQAVDAANQRIDENRRQLEAINDALKKASQS